jgi:hypothetical protein
MGLGSRVSSVVAFLRAGHPTGPPVAGFVPLLALLRRRLTDDEITMISRKFSAHRRQLHDRPVDQADVGVEITRITDELPGPDDIRRVQDRLAAIERLGNRGG